MNIDTLTGLPIVSKGYFFRIVVRKSGHYYTPRPQLHVQLRKKKFFGMFSVPKASKVVVDYWRGSSACIDVAKQNLPEYADTLWKAHLRDQKDIAAAKVLLGDYPPKKL